MIVLKSLMTETSCKIMAELETADIPTNPYIAKRVCNTKVVWRMVVWTSPLLASALHFNDIKETIAHSCMLVIGK